MNRSYQQRFLRNTSHGENETHLNSIGPVSVGELNEKTNPLYSSRPTLSRATHNKEQPQGEIPSKSRGELFSSRLVGEEEWHQLVSESKPKTQKSRSRKLSEVIKQGPSIENGKLTLVSSYITEIDLLPSKISTNISTLYLSHNSLSSLINLQQFKYVKNLSLSNNSIRYLHSLSPLSSLSLLEKLSLEGNIVTQMPYYREIVIGLCSTELNCSLEILDSIRVSVEEKTNNRIIYKRCCVQIEQMRCGSLRVAILDHMQKLFSCHAEVISLVVGRFRNFLGDHIDVNPEINTPISSSSISMTLRYALAGGVYRWLQLSGGRDFEMNSQDLAYRLFLISLRKFAPSKKQALFGNPSALLAHWDAVTMETNQHYQQHCLSLVEKCESSHEKVLSASRTGGKRNGTTSIFRRSREFEAMTSEIGIHQLSVERDFHSTGSTRGIETFHSLQQLQFVGCEVFRDPLTGFDKSPNTYPNDPYIFEIQQTYCGMGLHYHSPLSHTSDGRTPQKKSSERKNTSEPQNLSSTKPPSDINPEDVSTRRKYMSLLKNGMHKKGTTTENKKEVEKVSHIRCNTKPDKVLTTLISDAIIPEGEKVQQISGEFLKEKDMEVLQSNLFHESSSPQNFPTSVCESLCEKVPINELISLLLSPKLNTFLQSAPSLMSGELTPPFQHHSIEWSIGIFANSNLPISESFRVALATLSDSPQDSLADYIGSPPVPLPSFPSLSQTKMRELSVLQDSLSCEEEHVIAHTNSLLHHRRNLLASSEKVKKFIESQKLIAVSNLRELVKLVEADRLDIHNLRSTVASTDFIFQLIQTNEFLRAEQITQLEEELDSLKQILKEIDNEDQRKQELMDASEEVSAAVFAMKDEIQNSPELQSCLRARYLSDLFFRHLSSPHYQLSLKRSIFTKFRRITFRQRQARIMAFEGNLKKRIHVLLYCWAKLQKYLTNVRQERKAVSWIKKNQLYKWLIQWKCVFSHRRQEKEFVISRNWRRQKTAILRWRQHLRFLKRRQDCERQFRSRTDLLLKKWIFRSWKNAVEAQVAHFRIEHRVMGQNKISNLTLSIRHREIDDKKKLSAAQHFHLGSLFRGWKSATRRGKIDLQDREFVVYSFHTRRHLKSCFKEWYNILISSSFERNQKSQKYWARFKRYTTVLKWSHQILRRSCEFHSMSRSHKVFYHWVRFQQSKVRRRRRDREITGFLSRRKIVSTFSKWLRVITAKANLRRQMSVALTLYFFTLMKQSWVKWFRWYESEKRLKQRKLEWVRMEQEKELWDRREEVQNRLKREEIIGHSDIDWNVLISEDEFESKLMRNRRDPLPDIKVSQIKMRWAIFSWIQIARRKRRLRVAERLTFSTFQTRKIGRIFSFLIGKWAQSCLARIEEGKSLSDGLLSLQQRSTTSREKILTLQQEVVTQRAQLDQSRSLLAEKQTHFDTLSVSACTLEDELNIYRNTIDEKTREQSKQNEVIKSILFLCKGQSNQSSSSPETNGKDLARFLTEKICLLSSLEKCNEDALATNRFKEREKSKLDQQIREGLSIGQRYKQILQSLTPEREKLEEERQLGERRLEECHQQLEFVLTRVQEKLSIDQREINDLEREKVELMQRIDRALAEENHLREELNYLRRETSQIDQNLEDSKEALSSKHRILASENLASSVSILSSSEKTLSQSSISSSRALRTFIEKCDPLLETETLSPSRQTLRKQLAHMERDDNSEYLKKITAFAASPPSVTSGPELEFDSSQSTSCRSDSLEDIAGISNQIQSISSRIRARLQSPPSV